MPAHKIIFTSHSTQFFPESDIPEWVRQNAVRNRREGVTGLLFHKNGKFLHLLEGGREAVESLLDELRGDKRFDEVTLLHSSAIFIPRCRDWGLLQVDGPDWGIEQWEHATLPETGEGAQEWVDSALRTYRDKRIAA
jgi:hypothetical protein